MIKRSIFSSIQKHLNAKEITLITGPRQAGKTTLLLSLKKELEKQGKKVLDLNLDIEEDKQYIVSQRVLVDKIENKLGKTGGYVFLDEIQRKENAGLFLKGIYDMRLPYKFVVTGSGSLKLKEKIHESLAGRKLIFELGTLSFEEFIQFKTEYRHDNLIVDFFGANPAHGHRLLAEYLQYGGYPRVVLESADSDKLRVIREIYQSYLEKDAIGLLGAGKTQAFMLLTRLIAEQAGKLINTTELSSTLDLSIVTIKQYLWYLEKTFILRKVTPYFRNVRKEITKASLAYFFDLGLRNFSADAFGHSISPATGGFLFQNFVFNILREKYNYTPATIHFWRTKDKSEVDFVVDRGAIAVPFEVKYSELSEPAIPRSLRSFIAKYNPPIAYVVHLGQHLETTVENTKIICIPYYELLTLET